MQTSQSMESIESIHSHKKLSPQNLCFFFLPPVWYARFALYAWAVAFIGFLWMLLAYTPQLSAPLPGIRAAFQTKPFNRFAKQPSWVTVDPNDPGHGPAKLQKLWRRQRIESRRLGKGMTYYFSNVNSTPQQPAPSPRPLVRCVLLLPGRWDDAGVLFQNLVNRWRQSNARGQFMTSLQMSRSQMPAAGRGARSLRLQRMRSSRHSASFGLLGGVKGGWGGKRPSPPAGRRPPYGWGLFLILGA